VLDLDATVGIGRHDRRAAAFLRAAL